MEDIRFTKKQDSRKNIFKWKWKYLLYLLIIFIIIFPSLSAELFANWFNMFFGTFIEIINNGG
jgi:polyferredoxin